MYHLILAFRSELWLEDLEAESLSYVWQDDQGQLVPFPEQLPVTRVHKAETVKQCENM